MQKTLLRGETTIFGSRVIDSVAVKQKKEGSEKYSRTSLKMAHWVAVMKAGLALYRIGTFDSGADCPVKKNQPRVILHLPKSDSPEAIVEFHNRLMQLCAMPYEALIQKISAKAGSKSKSAAAEKPKELQAPEGAPAQGSGSCQSAVLGFQAC